MTAPAVSEIIKELKRLSVDPITDEELALILEALDDAAFYRDSRSHVLRSAKRRTLRSHSPAIDGEGGGPGGGGSGNWAKSLKD